MALTPATLNLASPTPGSIYVTPNEGATTPTAGNPRPGASGTEPFPDVDAYDEQFDSQRDGQQREQLEQQRHKERQQAFMNEQHQVYESQQLPFAPHAPAEELSLDEPSQSKTHWGLRPKLEYALFYVWAVPSWILEIAAAVCGAYLKTDSPQFIATVTVFLVLHWAAFLQTVVSMIQRCSWYRESEKQMEEHRQFYYLSIRLNRLCFPTALIALPTFIVAYVRRHPEQDLAYWLLFLLFFIINTVVCVMNAYNNITWEGYLLQYEEGVDPIRGSRFAILGF